jgi:CRP/FNR family transcriptional regulator, cyclic AMP receptor protein
MSATLTLIEKTIFMKSVDVFEAIPTEALAQLAALAVERSFDRGDLVFREGDSDCGVVLVVEGAIELRKGETVVRLLERGSVQGQLFLEESEASEYAAVAVQDTQVLSLQHRDVLQALLDFPEFALAMVQDLARRNHQVVARVIELEDQLATSSAQPAAPLPIEPVTPAPELPKRRGWWRLAARTQRTPRGA